MKPFPYEDILFENPPQSGKHPKMTLLNRAAQFAPFAALSGHGAALVETARETEQRPAVADDELAEADRTLEQLRLKLRQRQFPLVTVTFFAPDERKEGGHLVTETGRLQRIDGQRGALIFENGRRIAVGDLIHLEETDRLEIRD